MKEIQIQVNPYLEYINSILLTGRYNEITAPVIGYGLMTDEVNEYTTDIKAFLEPYRRHPLYTYVEDRITEGFTFSRPVELALSLGECADFSMQYELAELCVAYCGGWEKIEELLRLWKAFEKEVDFLSFYHKKRTFYDTYLERTRQVTDAHSYVEMLEAQYGKALGSYRLVLTSLMKGNFGFKLKDRKSGQSMVYSVMSTYADCISPIILLHEFSHPFINPLTENYAELVAAYQEAYERLKPYKLPAFGSGYGDWEECVNEHLVRAMVIHMLQKCNQQEVAEEMLRQEHYNGYRYVPQLLERYAYYDRNRETYPEFESYYPELLKVFGEPF